MCNKCTNQMKCSNEYVIWLINMTEGLGIALGALILVMIDDLVQDQTKQFDNLNRLRFGGRSCTKYTQLGR